MAEGLLRARAGDRYEVFSAGLDPTSVHPLAIQVMNEMNIDISHHRSKSAKEFLSKIPFSAVIFVCQQAEDHCPRFYPPLIPLCWPVEDPAACQGSAEERLKKFREVRDLIDSRIRDWLAERTQSLSMASIDHT